MMKLFALAILVAAIAVPSVLFATQGQQGTEARINAYKHDDGSVEFGMQVRDGEGWSERILPRGRFLRDNSATGKWLNSTPVSISVTPDIWWDPPTIGRGSLDYITYETENWDAPAATGRLSTSITLSSKATKNDSGRKTTATLELQCVSSGFYTKDGEPILNKSIGLGGVGISGFSAKVRFRFQASRAYQEQYGAEVYAVLDNVGSAFDYPEVRYRYQTHFSATGEPSIGIVTPRKDDLPSRWEWLSSLEIDYWTLYGWILFADYADELIVGVVGFVGDERESAEVFEATFDLDALRKTPVIGNITTCGLY